MSEAREAAERSRLQYAEQMEHLAKYAAAEVINVRQDGVAPDGLAGAVLERCLATYRLWVQDDRSARMIENRASRRDL